MYTWKKHKCSNKPSETAAKMPIIEMNVKKMVSCTLIPSVVWFDVSCATSNIVSVTFDIVSGEMVVSLSATINVSLKMADEIDSIWLMSVSLAMAGSVV